MTNVPLIDVAPARHGGRDERCRVAAAIDGACREIGFFAISGHGLPDRLVDVLRRLAHDFFGLPLADKLRCRHPVEGTNRGYHPVGGETLSKANDAAAPPDLKEFFHVGARSTRPRTRTIRARAGAGTSSPTSGRPCRRAWPRRRPSTTAP